MVIGFDTSRAFTKNRTGTENYSYQILKNLAKIDIENHYLVYIRPGIKVKPENWPSNFKFIIIPYPRLWTQFGLAKQTFQDYLDVLFIPAHTLPLIHKPGLKTVVTVHDLGVEYLPQTHQLKQRLYLKLMTDYQLKSATRLIAVSNTTKRDLINKIGITGDKISVVYEGYNEQLFKPVTGQKLADELKTYNLEPDSYFLFVGTIQPRKNLERLITAYRQFMMGGGERGAPLSPRSEARRSNGAAAIRQDPSHIKLVLAGSKGWLSDKIYSLPKRLGIEKNIKFIGYIPDEKLPALYSGAKAFLFPSLFEGFGLPILEAMACNCPIMTSNTSSCPEVTGKAAVLVDPYSIGSITDGIGKISNKKLTDALIKEGQQQIKKFSWEKAAKETLKILQKTTNK